MTDLRYPNCRRQWWQKWNKNYAVCVITWICVKYSVRKIPLCICNYRLTYLFIHCQQDIKFLTFYTFNRKKSPQGLISYEKKTPTFVILQVISSFLKMNYNVPWSSNARLIARIQLFLCYYNLNNFHLIVLKAEYA